MLARLRPPPTVHDESHYRVWQRRFYPFNVYSERKRLEKLNYMHHNPVKHGLVSSPGGLAVVELEVLLLAGCVGLDHGPTGMSLSSHKSLREIADPKEQGSAPAGHKPSV